MHDTNSQEGSDSICVDFGSYQNHITQECEVLITLTRCGCTFKESIQGFTGTETLQILFSDASNSMKIKELFNPT